MSVLFSTRAGSRLALALAAAVTVAAPGLVHAQTVDRTNRFATDNIKRFDTNRYRLDSGRVEPNFKSPRVESYTVDDGLPGGRRIIDGTGRYRTDRLGRVWGPTGATPAGRIR